MQIQKSEAERLLGVSYTTFYSYVNKLWIQLISKTDSRGKSSFIEWTDLEQMAKAMGKTLVEEAPNETSKQAKSEVEESNEYVQEKFNLQLKIKEQEETIRSSNEMLHIYKEQSSVLQEQQKLAQEKVNTLYLQIIQTSNLATTYKISAIALLVLLLTFVGLSVFGLLQL
jgi:hypothetical protein